MTKEVQDYVTEKTKDLMAAQSCCQEAKDAAQAWLDSLGTDQEAAQTEAYIKELEADVNTIDHVIAFASTDMAKKALGDRAAGFLAHAQQVKAQGGKYCDCPACSAGAAILEKKEEMLA